jgi:site-specific DNA recombinase
MRIEARRAFASAYRKARLWLDRLVAELDMSTAAIAHGERRTERSVRQTLSLAFLDPALVEAAMEGRLPRGFGLKRLIDLPPHWPQQWTALGLVALGPR